MRAVADPPNNEWERAYQASVEAEYRARLEAEQAHARQMAVMPPHERRRMRRQYILIGVLMGPLLLAGIIVDGVASHDVVSGHAVSGTAVLTKQVDVCAGRPPCIPYWEAHFASDDGTMNRVLVFAEDVPATEAFAGSRVPARWTSVRPDNVFLAKSKAFRDWFWSTIIIVAAGLAVCAVAIVVLRRRARLRRRIESERAGPTDRAEPTAP
jgi:hypothetical protein